MTKLLDVLSKSGRKYLKHKGELGLEIETETIHEYKVPSFSFWDVKPDGSLRDFGIEYVLKKPLNFKNELPQALEEFRDKTKTIEFKKNSITTSVHVHINMLNESIKTLGNFFTAYALVENLLVRYAGENRRSNGFSLPICDAEITYENIRTILSGLERQSPKAIAIAPDNAKYAGLNVASLYGIGSLEVRLFRGTTDIKEITDWVSILYEILTYSRQVTNPHNIIKEYKNKESRLLQDIFKDRYKLIQHAEERELVEQNFLYATNIAYTIKDWNKADKNFEPKKKATPADIDVIAQRMFHGTNFDDLTPARQRAVMDILNDPPLLEQILGRNNLPHHPQEAQNAQNAQGVQQVEWVDHVDDAQRAWQRAEQIARERRQINPFNEPLRNRPVGEFVDELEDDF